MGKSEEDLGVVAGLVRASFLVNAVYAESAREYGLTVQQGQLLCVLMGRPYGMSDLGGTLGLEKSSLTGLVDRAVRRGLVRREPDPDDRRAVQVLLTPEGRELAEDFYAATCRRVDELAAGLGSQDRDRLAALLGAIVRDNEAPTVFLDALQP
jgi:DNA-binding MarR family transcriptional regulator